MSNESTYFAGGRGHRIMTVGVNPGAGNNFTISLNSTHFHRLLYIKFVLSCDANVANRHVHALGFTGALQYYEMSSHVIATANDAFTYIMMSQKPALDLSATMNYVYDSLPTDLIIAPGDALNIAITNIQVGDTLTGILYILEDYLAL